MHKKFYAFIKIKNNEIGEVIDEVIQYLNFKIKKKILFYNITDVMNYLS